MDFALGCIHSVSQIECIASSRPTQDHCPGCRQLGTVQGSRTNTPIQPQGFIGDSVGTRTFPERHKTRLIHTPGIHQGGSCLSPTSAFLITLASHKLPVRKWIYLYLQWNHNLHLSLYRTRKRPHRRQPGLCHWRR